MTDDNKPVKPREWWIEHKQFVDEWIYEAFVSDVERTNKEISPFHVIEYSAYAALQAEVDLLKNQAIDEGTEYRNKMEALKAEQSLLLDGLEFIASGNLPNGDHVEGATAEFADDILEANNKAKGE